MNKKVLKGAVISAILGGGLIGSVVLTPPKATMCGFELNFDKPTQVGSQEFLNAVSDVISDRPVEAREAVKLGCVKEILTVRNEDNADVIGAKFLSEGCRDMDVADYLKKRTEVANKLKDRSNYISNGDNLAQIQANVREFNEVSNYELMKKCGKGIGEAFYTAKEINL